MNVITAKDNEDFILNMLKEYQKAALEGTSLAYEKATENMWDICEDYYNKLFRKENNNCFTH